MMLIDGSYALTRVAQKAAAARNAAVVAAAVKKKTKSPTPAPTMSDAEYNKLYGINATPTCQHSSCGFNMSATAGYLVAYSAWLILNNAPAIACLGATDGTASKACFGAGVGWSGFSNTMLPAPVFGKCLYLGWDTRLQPVVDPYTC